MIAFEGFGQMILNFLRIPPGTSLRKAQTSPGDKLAGGPQSHELINTIIDITSDDVCIGNTPLYYTGGDDSIKEKLDEVFEQFNKIVKWATTDLLAVGYSIYKTSVIDGKFVIVPYLEEVSFFLDKKGEVQAYGEDYVKLSEHLVFLNYEKTSLRLIEDEIEELPSNILYQIEPTSIQLKNIGSLIKDLTVTERSLLRYRFPNKQNCKVL